MFQKIVCCATCLFSFLLYTGLVFAAEITIKDSEDQTAWLYTPSDEPEPNKTYWLVIGVHGAGADGKGACGITPWAEGNVIVLGPSFVQPPKNPDAIKSGGLPNNSYQMAGPTHVGKT